MSIDETRVTYEQAAGGGWFADYRDGNGRLIQCGLGTTQADALAHLADRMERQS
jgi:hypothetical protein